MADLLESTHFDNSNEYKYNILFSIVNKKLSGLNGKR